MSKQWDESVRGAKMSNATGRVIYKYPVPALESFTLHLPKDAEIIRIDAIDGFTWLWAVVRTDAEYEPRQFMAFKTGAKIPDNSNLKYIGFYPIYVQMELGLYVFEVI